MQKATIFALQKLLIKHYRTSEMKTNIINIIISLFLFGCSSNKQKQTKIDTPTPPVFVSDLLNAKELQINRLPHPFNLNGSVPFAVWADGKKLNLKPKQTIELARYLGIKFEQPPDTAEIHSGQGWLHPYPSPTNKNINQANKPQNLPFNTEIR